MIDLKELIKMRENYISQRTHAHQLYHQLCGAITVIEDQISKLEKDEKNGRADIEEEKEPS